MSSEYDDFLPSSPVPLNKEELENAEVRRLAVALAPALEQAEEALLAAVPNDLPANDRHKEEEEEDDDLDQELEDLQASEQMLRNELEMAGDLSTLFPIRVVQVVEETLPETPTRNVTRSMNPDIDEQEEQHPEYLMLNNNRKDLPPIRIPTPVGTPSEKANNNTATPERDQIPTSPVFWAQSNRNPVPYTFDDHFKALKLRLTNGLYVVDLTSHVQQLSQSTTTEHTIPSLQELCTAIPSSQLKAFFIGLIDNTVLPVRTLMIRIRPDVLCGAVMDAVQHGIETLLPNARIRKRQGGHLRGTVAEIIVNDIVYPSFAVEAQLCTYKTDDCERMLLLQIYHVPPDETPEEWNQKSAAAASEPSLDDIQSSGLSFSGNSTLSEPIQVAPSMHLRECCALIQRTQAPDLGKKIRPTQNLETMNDMAQAVSTHLLTHYRACPSVRDGKVTLPSLNPDDWKVVVSSWRLIETLWNELESRDLTYNTLETSPFGAFPSLSTLDVHYCSQIRRVSRERMIVQLLKSASELEEYAREAEYACANLIKMLQPTFEAYGVDPPSLPKAKALTEYPLEFNAPQAACPPWGTKVMEALNEIQALTSNHGSAHFDPSAVRNIDANHSLDMATKAVQLVFEAFQTQDDEEQSARLGRKNVQVMDRLSKMRAHQRLSIEALKGSINISEKARKATEDFRSKTGVYEVPLLKWSIVVGSSSGSCIVTAHHILFVTQRIPVIGGNQSSLFTIRELDFVLNEATATLLNPLPTVISVTKGGEEVYTFRPSFGGARLKSFLDIVKEAAREEMSPMG